MPRTSVVIPCYNGQTHLAEAVISALEQASPPLDVIVVDDGSRVPITLPERASRARLIRTEHRGLAAARNRGIAEARGEFVAFLDSDDWWDPGKLQLQETALDDRPDAVASYTRCASAAGYFAFGPYPDEHVNRHTLTRAVWSEMFFPPSTLFVRRAILERVGGFREDLQIWEDFDLYMKLLAQGEFVQIPKPLTWYRVHPTQMTRTMDKRAQLLNRKRARRGFLEEHRAWLEQCGIAGEAAWAPYRRDLMLAYYRRDFPAARRLLWDYWRDHPSDRRILLYAVTALLPAPIVAWLRGTLEPGPADQAPGDDRRTWADLIRGIDRGLGS